MNSLLADLNDPGLLLHINHSVSKSNPAFPLRFGTLVWPRRSTKYVLKLGNGNKEPTQGWWFLWVPDPHSSGFPWTGGPATHHVLNPSDHSAYWIYALVFWYLSGNLIDISTFLSSQKQAEFQDNFLGTRKKKKNCFDSQTLNSTSPLLPLCLLTIKILIFWDKLMPWVEKGECHII